MQIHNTRAGVLQSKEEATLWRTATTDLMLNEENSILDGRQMWVVWPPAHSTEPERATEHTGCRPEVPWEAPCMVNVDGFTMDTTA